MLKYQGLINSHRARAPLYRKSVCPHVFCLTVFAIGLGLAEKPAHAQRLDKEVVRFVGEVSIDAEYTGNNHVLMRWARPARLSLFDADDRQTEIVTAAVDKINNALAVTDMNIEMGAPHDDNATLKVYFAPLRQLPEIAQTEDFPYVEGNWGYFYVRWNRKFEIESAVVMLASDKLRGARLKHFALEEITQALGLPGDSKRFKNSVFYEDQSERENGTATEFSSLDAKLLRFIYQRVEPGAHAVELGLLMAEHWRDAR